MIFYFL